MSIETKIKIMSPAEVRQRNVDEAALYGAQLLSAIGSEITNGRSTVVKFAVHASYSDDAIAHAIASLQAVGWHVAQHGALGRTLMITEHADAPPSPGPQHVKVPGS